MPRSSSTDNTRPEPDSVRATGTSERLLHGLVCVACAGEPRRLGTFVLAQTGSPRVFGRGAAGADDPAPRAIIVRVRPGNLEPFAPPEQPALSRSQLLIERKGEGLRVENVGRCRMTVNGEAATNADLRDGDVIELGRQMALMVAMRRSVPEPVVEPLQPFGDADELGIVGESEVTWQLRRQIRFVRERRGHALIHGASGVGKELVARAVAAVGPFVSRNAATFPETLIDSELFGNERGYPNTGTPERTGLVGAAEGGSLFLDEIAELPMGLQPRLLRVLDDGEYQRLGETRTRKASFRLIGATNRPLSALREDLLARFAFRIEVPTLAARRDDVPLIARYLLAGLLRHDHVLSARFCDHLVEPRVSSALLRQLLSVDFPGNVRGLRQLLVRSLMTSRGNELEPVAPEEPSAPPTAPSERDVVAAALQQNGGSVDKTWRALGLTSRFVLQRLMKKHGLSTGRR